MFRDAARHVSTVGMWRAASVLIMCRVRCALLCLKRIDNTTQKKGYIIDIALCKMSHRD